MLAQLFARFKRNVPNRWCRLKLLWAFGVRGTTGDLQSPATVVLVPLHYL